MTYSLVAFDPEEDAFGVAVASKFLAVGSVVPWAQAGVGAVATQALAKIGFGPDGLTFMARGHSAQATLDALLAADIAPQQRQVGIVDASGEAAAHTGASCISYAAHVTGEGFACQGNILTGPEVLEAMVAGYFSAQGEFADRLLAALMAGEAAGGDRRGKQSAALMVMKPGGGYGGDTDRYIDLRVDDHDEPVRKLGDLLDQHHLFFGVSRPEDQLPITEDIARELQSLMLRLGLYQGEVTGVWDDASKWAFWTLIGKENLEERWKLDVNPDEIDRVALKYLRQRFGQG